MQGENILEQNSYEHFMNLALKQAKKAENIDEVPVGAVVVLDNKVIATGYNKKNANKNSILHAEIVALNKAMKKLDDWHLNNCTLFVTLEPCPMCAGACINSRIGKIVFGAYDLKAGCCGSLYNLPEDKRFNHRPKVVGGIKQKECAEILSAYFLSKRKSAKKINGS